MTRLPNDIEVYPYLQYGARHVTTRQALCERLNVSRQILSRLILKERREGRPICTTGQGYFLAETREELLLFAKRLRHRAGEIFATRRACLKMAEQLPTREEAAKVCE